jgi:uncharacterized membrane protein
MSSGSAFAAPSVPAEALEPHLILITPNCSLTPRTAALFLLATGGATLLIAGFLAIRGLWPILPFAGLEVGLLVWATRRSMRRGSDREVLEITENTVTIEAIHGANRQITVFPRQWAKVKLRAPRYGLHPSRLCLEGQGRTCEVGTCLTEDERRGLAVRLRQLIGGVQESPALSSTQR